VEKARRALELLLEGNRQEEQLFQGISHCWDQLQALDREVLSLAVQNINLKALRLSFVPAAAAVRSMEDALTRLMDGVASSPDAGPITRLAATAVMSALHPYTLHAPHIAESTATRMDELEAIMQRLDAQVTSALQGPQAMVDESGQPLLEAARASYTEFQRINAQIIDLSRQNSNIRSFTLSLGQKRTLTAQCQDALAALQEHVQQTMRYKATR
jgi:hypothetical protein